MSSLAGAVLLVHQANRGFRAAAGTVSCRSNRGVQEAIGRARPDLVDEQRRAGPEVWGGTLEPSGDVDAFWAELPDRFRLQRSAPSPLRVPGLVIVDGAQWWSYDPLSGAESNFGDPTAGVWLGPAPQLLDPAEFVAALDLELAGEDQVAGRAAVRLRGWPRKSLRRVSVAGLHVVASFADSYDLWFDSATGVCLRATSMLDDHPIMVTEITRIDFDADIAPDLLAFDLPEGTEIRRAPGRAARQQAPGTACHVGARGVPASR